MHYTSILAQIRSGGAVEALSKSVVPRTICGHLRRDRCAIHEHLHRVDYVIGSSFTAILCIA